MGRWTPGDRVGVMIGSDRATRTVKFLGYGTYEGETVPPPEAGGFNFGMPNPTLKLDNGKVCYGCETWWGTEERIKSEIAAWQADGWTIEIVDIDVERVAAKAEAPAQA